MPKTTTNSTGDGITTDLLTTNVQLPDTGTTVLVGGLVQHVGFSQVVITGSSLTFPTTPVSGIVNVIIQVDYTNGTPTVKSNTTAGTLPTTDANNVQIFSTILTTTDTNLALDKVNVTPDTY